ncbi:MAG: hypothetical protein KDA68_08130 [Planctomycetaceae bacterium]|nr:hypothetical protein [Planctomycetaceae bacterium]
MKSQMQALWNCFYPGRERRRISNSSTFSPAIEHYENRTLLSGAAIYPQPAVAVVPENVATAADPPADFSGIWFIFSPDGFGTTGFPQDGKKIDVNIPINGLRYAGSGKVKGNTAKVKVKNSTADQTIKGKLTMTLSNPFALQGNLFIKKSPTGPLNIPFTGAIDGLS